MTRAALLTLLAITAWTICARAQAPSAEEIRRLIDEKNYPQALQKITAGLALRGNAAAAVDRYQLLMLKGECHLRLKAMSYATEAYAAAAKEQTASPPERAVAAAHEMLVRQSKGLAYAPKTSPDKSRPAPIDILEKESRRRAFAAMLADELAANEAKIAATRTAKSLDTVAALFKPLGTLYGIELAASGDPAGDAPRTKALRTDLADRAKRMIADALRTLSKRVGEIDKEANTFIETYQERQVPHYSNPGVARSGPQAPAARTIREKVYKKKGLTDPQLDELRQVNATCDKLPQAMIEIAQGLTAAENTFDPFGEEASRLRREVDRLLDTDFQRIYREIPK